MKYITLLFLSVLSLNAFALQPYNYNFPQNNSFNSFNSAMDGYMMGRALRNSNNINDYNNYLQQQRLQKQIEQQQELIDLMKKNQNSNNNQQNRQIECTEKPFGYGFICKEY